MLPRRPKPGETEEDLLRLMEEFEKQKEKASIAAENILKQKRTAAEKEIREQSEGQGDGGRSPTQKKKSKFAQSREQHLKQTNLHSKVSDEDPIRQINPLNETNTLVLTEVVEKNYSSGTMVASPAIANQPFPSIIKADKDLNTVGFGTKKKSLFAQQLERSGNAVPTQIQTPKYSAENDAIRNRNAKSLPNSEVFGSKSFIVDGSGLDKSEDAKAIHEENLNKLQSMTEDEILKERANLMSTLDDSVITFLRNKRQPVKTEKMDTNEEEPKIMKSEIVEEDKMKWMEDLPPVNANVIDKQSGFSARFDLNGILMPYTSDVPVNQGLHHHGEEPERPGYTIEELLTLARSTFTQQKILAINVLEKVLSNTKKGIFDNVLEQNILEELLNHDLLFLLRIGIDDSTESVRSACLACLANLLSSEIDELCLDYTFTWFMSEVQPSLPTKITYAGPDKG